ncbi:NAD(P)H-dependent flavin oxidoreductase [Sporosarcina cyprini]|uniref:NAD(P)H-dependent flavin oxidoreductase n=1 Tax=Sporosarcina cyprini TaxID=2910523 RepID=UPI001EDDA131|nr:nitronate monooxygenase family protein [Sporosarcina cyprini]MCG3087389.1 nitronate monooxygenase family protein [Sporosarcina cyprini]
MKWKTRVTDMLGIELPIIQGGLAYLAYAELASAVSNAGGLGQITAMSLESPELLRQQIKKVKQLTDKPFGVNFAIGQHGRPFEHMVEAALDEGVDIMSVTGGNPAPFFDMLRGTSVKKLVLVAAKRQAVKAEELGADAVMVVGQEGGGHLGRDDIGTMVLVPQVVDSVKIPVIASGGIGDGRGWMAAHALGAEGIEMGTRFIATKECVHASKAYQEAVVQSAETGTAIIKRSLGAPARALKGPWTEKILRLESESAGYEGLKPYISGEANRRFIHEGNPEQGFGWAGQVAGLINDIPTVQELFDWMVCEATEIRKRWGYEGEC